MLSKIYIHYPGNEDDLLKLIAILVNGNIHKHYVNTELLEFDLWQNSFADSESCKNTQDGFLYHSYYIDVFTSIKESQVDRSNVIIVLSHLISELWKLNIPAVVAGDFEEELPEQGGGLSPNVPRPH